MLVERGIIRQAKGSVGRAGMSVCYVWGKTIARVAVRDIICREVIVWGIARKAISKVYS